MNTYDPEVVRITGRLIAMMTPAQLAQARAAAERRGMFVSEYVRTRLTPRVLRNGGSS